MVPTLRLIADRIGPYTREPGSGAEPRQDGVKTVAAGARRGVNGGMADLIFVAIFVGMMVVALGYVRLCERIVRSDERSERAAHR
jgi:hypothetical protein